jgi:hypothetical protein
VKVDSRLLGVSMPGSAIVQTKPGRSRNLYYLLSSEPLTDAVVFAHDVNRTAGLPFQTFNSCLQKGLDRETEGESGYRGLASTLTVGEYSIHHNLFVRETDKKILSLLWYTYSELN